MLYYMKLTIKVSIKTRLTHLEKKNRKSIQRHRKELISDTSKMSMENKIRCEHGEIEITSRQEL